LIEEELRALTGMQDLPIVRLMDHVTLERWVTEPQLRKMGYLGTEGKCYSTGTVTRDDSQSAGKGNVFENAGHNVNRDIAIEAELLFQLIAVTGENNQP
jgi:hypothetical protein